MFINYGFGFGTVGYQFHLEPPSAPWEMDKSSKWISEAEPGTAFMNLVFLSKTAGSKGGIMSSPQKKPQNPQTTPLSCKRYLADKYP